MAENRKNRDKRSHERTNVETLSEHRILPYLGQWYRVDETPRGICSGKSLHTQAKGMTRGRYRDYSSRRVQTIRRCHSLFLSWDVWISFSERNSRMTRDICHYASRWMDELVLGYGRCKWNYTRTSRDL